MSARRSRGALQPAYRCDRSPRSLGRAASTVSRELQRNGGQRRYRAAAADSRAWDRALRPKACKLARHEELRQLVAAKLLTTGRPSRLPGG